MSENDPTFAPDKEEENPERDTTSRSPTVAHQSVYSAIEFHTNVMRAAIMGNIILIDFAFMLTFLAFYGIANLQSFLNAQDDLGTIGLCFHFSASLLSSISLPTDVIRILGCKWTICLCLATYIPYMISQFYVTSYTIIPTAIFCGIGSGPLWVAARTYLVIMTKTYSDLFNRPPKILIWHLSVTFFLAFQFAQIIGNVLSSLEFLEEMSNVTGIKYSATFCGAKYCPDKINSSHMIKAKTKQLHMLVTIYIVCIAGAVITVFFFVDSLTRSTQRKKILKTDRLKFIQDIFKLLTKKEHLFLVPIYIFVGCSETFIMADFNKVAVLIKTRKQSPMNMGPVMHTFRVMTAFVSIMAYIGCPWGVHKIGFIMACYGAMKGLSVLFCDLLVKQKGRVPVFICAFVVHASLLAILLFWVPTRSEKAYKFIISGLWGFCEGVWILGINALNGILIATNVEVEYSNYRFWKTIGQAVGFGYSPWPCIRTKVYILIGLLVVSIVGYTGTEISLKWSKREDISQPITITATRNDLPTDTPAITNEEKNTAQAVEPTE